MRTGIVLPAFANPSYRIAPDQFEALCRRVEDAGFAGVWVSDHLVDPSSYETSWLDPLPTLAVAARATNNVTVGTSIINVPVRHPITLAKTIGTVQHLSDGRLALGTGLGYLRQEYDVVSKPFDDRARLFIEAIEILTRLFEDGRIDYDGEYYSVEDFELQPKPEPKPRLLYGGNPRRKNGDRYLPYIMRRSLELGMGWHAPPTQPEVLSSDWEEVRSYLSSIHRDPDELRRSIHAYVHVVPDASEEAALERQREVFDDFFSDERMKEWPDDRGLYGSVSEIERTLGAWRDLGVEEVVLGPVVSDPDEIGSQIDLLADLQPS